MSMELDAKEAAILKMLSFFGSQATRLTDAELATYGEAVAEISVDAVQRSCRQFRDGLVERDNRFIPTPIELASNARQWDYAIAAVTASQELRKLERVTVYPIGGKPAPPGEPLGPIKVDFGAGEIDMSRMSPAEKEAVLRNKGLPQIETGDAKVPPSARLQRMRDQ